MKYFIDFSSAEYATYYLPHLLQNSLVIDLSYREPDKFAPPYIAAGKRSHAGLGGSV